MKPTITFVAIGTAIVAFVLLFYVHKPRYCESDHPKHFSRVDEGISMFMENCNASEQQRHIQIQSDKGIEFAELLENAKPEDAEGLINLGLHYVHTLGTDEDIWKGIALFTKASELGNVRGQYRLVLCYLMVLMNYPKAFAILQELEERGDTWAQARLGWCYRCGWGVEQDDSKAVEWFKKAAEGEDIEAYAMLAMCYTYGIGVEKDYEEALKWHLKVREQAPDSVYANYSPRTMEELFEDIQLREHNSKQPTP